jgi:hypothetical protein
LTGVWDLPASRVQPWANQKWSVSSKWSTLSFVLEGKLRPGTVKYRAEYWFLVSECVIFTYFSTFLPKIDTLKSKSRNILLYILICTHWEPQGTTKCGAIWIFGFGHKIDPP